MHKLRLLTAAQLSVNRGWRLALPGSDKQIPVKPHKLNIQFKLTTSYNVFTYSAKLKKNN